MNAPVPNPTTLPWQIKAILIAGAFGGMFPCLVRVAIAFTQGGDLPVSLTFTYWIGALLLAVLGGGVAWIFDEGNAKKAFFLGLSLPSFLQLQLSENIKSLATKDTAQLSWLISSAIAQVPTGVSAQDAPVAGRGITVGTPANIPVQVSFTDANGKDLVTYSVATPTATPLSVPDNATHVTFGKYDAKSAPIELSDKAKSVVKFDVTVKQDTHYGFLQALGAKPSVSATLQVKQTAASSTAPGG